MTKTNGVLRELETSLQILIHQVQPYIRGLRLPYYRNFAPNAEIHFAFPITILLGRNGTNKSSLLHALYGAPDDYSVGEYWFETHLDGIPRKNDAGQKPSVVHWYGAKGEEAHCVKARAPRDKDTNFDPDYWETVKPTARYGFPKRYKRCPPIRLTVRHLDFRGLLPAFDRYFYFPNKQHLNRRKAHAEAAGKLRRDYRPQDYLRVRTKGLRELLQAEGTRLTVVELEVLSYVLERDYTAGTLLHHNRFHGHDGWTFLFETNNLKDGYSEAFAGSGESAAAMLIHEVESAEEGSLLLLDEPETSLHPRAQQRMLQFLADRAASKKLQIVIATHAAEFARGLPQAAIRVLRENAVGKIEIDPTLTANEALHETITIPHGKTILVEDDRTRDVVLGELELQSPHAASEFNVVVRHGGTSRIYADIVAHARLGRRDLFVVFDGDQKPKGPIPELAKLPQGLSELKALIATYTCGRDPKGPKLDFASNKDAVAYIVFLREQVFYLPAPNPEELVWEKTEIAMLLPSGLPSKIATEQDFKNRLHLVAVEVPGFKADTVFSILLSKFLTGQSPARAELGDIVRKIRGA